MSICSPVSRIWYPSHLCRRDMQDHMDIGSSIRARFGWSISRTSPTPERKNFDEACKSYVLWKQEQSGRTTKTSRGRPLSASYASTNDPLFSSFASMSQEALDLDGLPAHSDANLSSPVLSFQSAAASNDERRRNSMSSFFAPKTPSIAIPPESRRLSRSLRVFVAWKPE